MNDLRVLALIDELIEEVGLDPHEAKIENLHITTIPDMQDAASVQIRVQAVKHPYVVNQHDELERDLHVFTIRK